MEKVNVYQMVTDRIIEQLEKGIVPWQKPWTGGFNDAVSYMNGKPYSFLNQMLLGQSGEYLTFNQVKSLGGSVKKGAKSRMVVFYSMYEKVIGKKEDGTDEIARHPILKYYKVFHINETEGIESKIKKVEEIHHEPIEMADKVAKCYVEKEGVELEICASNRAFYSPFCDKVVVPELKQYKVKEEYYSTLYHELTHSTGHDKRLARGLTSVLGGDSEYSKEELVAEIGAAMSLNRIGIDCEKAFANSVAYIKSWLKHLKNDNKMIVSASAKAEKAVGLIFGDMVVD